MLFELSRVSLRILVVLFLDINALLPLNVAGTDSLAKCLEKFGNSRGVFVLKRKSIGSELLFSQKSIMIRLVIQELFFYVIINC